MTRRSWAFYDLNTHLVCVQGGFPPRIFSNWILIVGWCAHTSGTICFPIERSPEKLVVMIAAPNRFAAARNATKACISKYTRSYLVAPINVGASRHPKLSTTTNWTRSSEKDVIICLNSCKSRASDDGNIIIFCSNSLEFCAPASFKNWSNKLDWESIAVGAKPRHSCMPITHQDRSCRCQCKTCLARIRRPDQFTNFPL